jgi:hypothetical protein
MARIARPCFGAACAAGATVPNAVVATNTAATTLMVLIRIRLILVLPDVVVLIGQPLSIEVNPVLDDQFGLYKRY